MTAFLPWPSQNSKSDNQSKALSRSPFFAATISSQRPFSTSCIWARALIWAHLTKNKKKLMRAIVFVTLFRCTVLAPYVRGFGCVYVFDYSVGLWREDLHFLDRYSMFPIDWGWLSLVLHCWHERVLQRKECFTRQWQIIPLGLNFS